MNTLEAMLNMIAPDNSFILNDEIGLLGEFDKNKDDFRENTYKGVIHLPCYDKPNEKRGDYFRVIDGDGCIMFDHYIKFTGILVNDDNSIDGYMFILKDFKATDEFEIFFDDEYECDAVVILQENKLYMNNIKGNELHEQFIIDKDIRLEYNNTSNHSLYFRGKRYIQTQYDTSYSNNNNIFIFQEVKLHL